MIKKIITIFVLAVFLLLLISYYLVGNYFYNISLNPSTDKSYVLDELQPTEEQKMIYSKELEWLGDNSSDTYINSTNYGNLKLHAYELLAKNESDIWTIIIHGYTEQGSGMISYAKEFYKRGYNVLLIDLRGHGLSEGDYIGMGWHDRLDVIDWINYIIDKNENSKIMLFGVSMGAATTMMTTGENLPSNVKLAIADCGYTSAWDEFGYHLNILFNLPEFPVLYAANSVCKIRAKYSFKDASSVEQVKKSHTPTLFIHGSFDNFVPFEMLDVIYEAAACEKEKLVIEGAGHCMASTVNPQLYWKTIEEFIDNYL